MIEGEYSGRMAALGDTVLDALAATQEAPTVRKAKEPQLQRCPSCAHARILIRGFVAVICAECHDGITELANRRLCE